MVYGVGVGALVDTYVCWLLGGYLSDQAVRSKEVEDCGAGAAVVTDEIASDCQVLSAASHARCGAHGEAARNMSSPPAIMLGPNRPMSMPQIVGE